MQTHAFLRGICRHLHFIRNHTKTHTFREEMAKYLWYFIKFMCFYVVLFALQKRRYLQWFRALEENHTIWAFWGMILYAPVRCILSLGMILYAYLRCILSLGMILYAYVRCILSLGMILYAYLRCILSLGTILHAYVRCILSLGMILYAYLPFICCLQNRSKTRANFT